jgi:diguanylate cyclase (GGDEF)-like protein/PAS domain S-box-containing protein
MWKGKRVLELMHQLKKNIPLIFVVRDWKREIVAELIMGGVSDCIAMNNIGHLPVAVLRALEEKALREERDRAQEELRRSEARYRALAGNFSYGIFHCNSVGRFIDVNQALVTILGFETKDKLMAVNLMGDIIQDVGKLAQLLGRTEELEPLEVEWRCRDSKTVRVRLSAQRVANGTDTYEVIVEDITKQRALEDHLRYLAASDPLTGLANYRHLIEVLDMEIKRSKRTGREFALLLLDVDGLKRINDQYGHLIGNQALCRVADVLQMCCRDIDSAARFGGDEFAVVLPEVDKEGANSVALRVCANIGNDGKGPDLSVSVGVAVYPEDGEKIDGLMKAADSMMYASKTEKLRL